MSSSVATRGDSKCLRQKYEEAADGISMIVTCKNSCDA